MPKKTLPPLFAEQPALEGLDAAVDSLFADDLDLAVDKLFDLDGPEVPEGQEAPKPGDRTPEDLQKARKALKGLDPFPSSSNLFASHPAPSPEQTTEPVRIGRQLSVPLREEGQPPGLVAQQQQAEEQAFRSVGLEAQPIDVLQLRRAYLDGLPEGQRKRLEADPGLVAAQIPLRFASGAGDAILGPAQGIVNEVVSAGLGDQRQAFAVEFKRQGIKAPQELIAPPPKLHFSLIDELERRDILLEANLMEKIGQGTGSFVGFITPISRGLSIARGAAVGLGGAQLSLLGTEMLAFSTATVLEMRQQARVSGFGVENLAPRDYVKGAGLAAGLPLVGRSVNHFANVVEKLTRHEIGHVVRRELTNTLFAGGEATAVAREVSEDGFTREEVEQIVEAGLSTYLGLRISGVYETLFDDPYRARTQRGVNQQIDIADTVYREIQPDLSGVKVDTKGRVTGLTQDKLTQRIRESQAEAFLANNEVRISKPLTTKALRREQLARDIPVPELQKLFGITEPAAVRLKKKVRKMSADDRANIEDAKHREAVRQIAQARGDAVEKEIRFRFNEMHPTEEARYRAKREQFDEAEMHDLIESLPTAEQARAFLKDPLNEAMVDRMIESKTAEQVVRDIQSEADRAEAQRKRTEEEDAAFAQRRAEIEAERNPPVPESKTAVQKRAGRFGKEGRAATEREKTLEGARVAAEEQLAKKERRAAESEPEPTQASSVLGGDVAVGKSQKSPKRAGRGGPKSGRPGPPADVTPLTELTAKGKVRAKRSTAQADATRLKKKNPKGEFEIREVDGGFQVHEKTKIPFKKGRGARGKFSSRLELPEKLAGEGLSERPASDFDAAAKAPEPPPAPERKAANAAAAEAVGERPAEGQTAFDSAVQKLDAKTRKALEVRAAKQASEAKRQELIDKLEADEGGINLLGLGAAIGSVAAAAAASKGDEEDAGLGLAAAAWWGLFGKGKGRGPGGNKPPRGRRSWEADLTSSHEQARANRVKAQKTYDAEAKSITKGKPTVGEVERAIFDVDQNVDMSMIDPVTINNRKFEVMQPDGTTREVEMPGNTYRREVLAGGHIREIPSEVFPPTEFGISLIKKVGDKIGQRGVSPMDFTLPMGRGFEAFGPAGHALNAGLQTATWNYRSRVNATLWNLRQQNWQSKLELYKPLNMREEAELILLMESNFDHPKGSLAHDFAKTKRGVRRGAALGGLVGGGFGAAVGGPVGAAAGAAVGATGAAIKLSRKSNNRVRAIAELMTRTDRNRVGEFTEGMSAKELADIETYKRYWDDIMTGVSAEANQMQLTEIPLLRPDGSYVPYMMRDEVHFPSLIDSSKRMNNEVGFEGKTDPLTKEDKRIEKFFDQNTERARSYQEQIAANILEKKIFVPFEDVMGHKPGPGDPARIPITRNVILDYLQQNAHTRFSNMFRTPIDKVAKQKSKFLEGNRMLYGDVGRVWDPNVLMRMYVTNAFRRIEMARVFGNEYEKAQIIIDNMQSGKREQLTRMFDIMTGSHPDYNQGRQFAFLNNASAFTTVSKLGLAPVSQLISWAQTAQHTRFTAYWKAWWKTVPIILDQANITNPAFRKAFVDKSLQRLMNESGVMMESELQLLFSESMRGLAPKASTFFLQKNTTIPIDRVGRMHGFIAGKMTAEAYLAEYQDVLRRRVVGEPRGLVQKTRAAKFKRDLRIAEGRLHEMYGEDPQILKLAMKGKLTEAEERFLLAYAGAQVVRRAHGRTEPIDMPLMTQHPVWSHMYKFQQFPLRMTAASHTNARNFTNAAKRGDVRRMAEMLSGIAAVLGVSATLRELRRLMKDQDRRDDPMWQWFIDTVAYAGYWSVYIDGFNAWVTERFGKREEQSSTFTPLGVPLPGGPTFQFLGDTGEMMLDTFNDTAHYGDMEFSPFTLWWLEQQPEPVRTRFLKEKRARHRRRIRSKEERRRD